MNALDAPPLDTLRAVVAGRARSVGAVVRRMDGLLPEGSPDAGAVTELDRRELALRLLRTVGTTENETILRALVPGPKRTVVLAELTGRGRVGLWESLADLRQLGLLDHEADRDMVSLTAGGQAALELVEGLCAGRDGRP